MPVHMTRPLARLHARARCRRGAGQAPWLRPNQRGVARRSVVACRRRRPDRRRRSCPARVNAGRLAVLHLQRLVGRVPADRLHRLRLPARIDLGVELEQVARRTAARPAGCASIAGFLTASAPARVKTTQAVGRRARDDEVPVAAVVTAPVARALTVVDSTSASMLGVPSIASIASLSVCVEEVARCAAPATSVIAACRHSTTSSDDAVSRTRKPLAG